MRNWHKSRNLWINSALKMNNIVNIVKRSVGRKDKDHHVLVMSLKIERDLKWVAETEQAIEI